MLKLMGKKNIYNFYVKKFFFTKPLGFVISEPEKKTRSLEFQEGSTSKMFQM